MDHNYVALSLILVWAIICIIAVNVKSGKGKDYDPYSDTSEDGFKLEGIHILILMLLAFPLMVILSLFNSVNDRWQKYKNRGKLNGNKFGF